MTGQESERQSVKTIEFFRHALFKQFSLLGSLQSESISNTGNFWNGIANLETFVNF